MIDGDRLLGAPIKAPQPWFLQFPDWLWDTNGALRIIVDADETPAGASEIGRWGAIWYDEDMCFEAGNGTCFVPEPSPTGYEMFNTGHIAYGQDVVRVGTVCGRGHAEKKVFERQSAEEAAEYHNQPEWQRLVGHCFDAMVPRRDGSGPRRCGVILGAGLPNLTLEQATNINLSGLSGEWFWRPRMQTAAGWVAGVDSIGPQLVNHPAIPSNQQAEHAGVRDLEVTATRAAWQTAPHLRPIRSSGVRPDQPKEQPMDQYGVKQTIEPIRAGGCCSACSPNPQPQTRAADELGAGGEQADTPMQADGMTAMRSDIGELRAMIETLQTELEALKVDLTSMAVSDMSVDDLANMDEMVAG